MSIFSERLTAARKAMNWTRKRAVAELNIPYQTYSNYEQGKREPDISTITVFADKLHTSTDYLLGNVNDPSPRNKDRRAVNPNPTFEDLGLPYKGVIPEDVNDMYRAIAKTYAEKHNLPKRDA